MTDATPHLDESGSWLVVTESADGERVTCGFVDAPSPQEAVVKWTGRPYEGTTAHVVPARHVTSLVVAPRWVAADGEA